jgi:hypothetical protein
MYSNNNSYNYFFTNNTHYHDQGRPEDYEGGEPNSKNLENVNTFIQKMASEYTHLPPQNNGELNKGFLEFISNFSNNNSPINFFNHNLFPVTEKHERYPNIESFLPFKSPQGTPNFQDNKNLSSFSLPGNVNPLNSMMMENLDKTPQNFLLNQNLKDYYQNYFHNNPQINTFNTLDQQMLLDSDTVKDANGNPDVKAKLPKLDIDMINYSDSSKIMSDRIINDLFIHSNHNNNNFENQKNNEEKTNFWQNIITSNNLNMKNHKSESEDEHTNVTGGNNDDFHVLKPHTMQLARDSTPPKNENNNFAKDCYLSGKKEKDVASPTTANKILSLNVSPKSAFVFKSNINK